MTPGLPSRYTFTGQYSYMDDPTTPAREGFGLMFYNARWYDPGLGRFTQADTIIPGGVQGLDRYAYVNNSPLKYTDPSGHFPLLVVVALVGAVIFFSQVPSDQYQPDPANHGDPTVMAVGFSLMLLPLAKEAAVAGLEAISSLGDNPAGLPDDPSLVPVDNLPIDPDIFPYPPSDPSSIGPYESPYGFPENTTDPPLDGWGWEGGGDPGSEKGQWLNPDKPKEALRWDPNKHKDKAPAHWDYVDPYKREWRIWPDGSMTPKFK